MLVGNNKHQCQTIFGVLHYDVGVEVGIFLFIAYYLFVVV